MGYIYKITNLINQKPYIGKTVNTIAVRWTKHKDEAFNQNSPYLIHCAMRKYGVENFIIEELEKCSDELLNEREQYWIKTINSYFKNGYGYKFQINCEQVPFPEGNFKKSDKVGIFIEGANTTGKNKLKPFRFN